MRNRRATLLVAAFVIAIATTVSVGGGARAATVTGYSLPSLPFPTGTDESVAVHVSTAHDGHVAGGTEKPPFSTKWTRAINSASYSLITGGRVFVTGVIPGASSASLFALDVGTGASLWGPVDIGSSVGLTAGDGKVFTLNGSGYLQAFDQTTGHQLWISALPGQWSFSSPPTYRNGLVYTGAAGSGGTVYAYNASTGSLVWTRSVMNGDNSSPAVTDTGVYVSYACPQAYDFEPASGALIWHYSGPCEGGGGNTVGVANGRVWSDDWAGGPVVLDATTGAVVGTYPAGPLPAFDGTKGFFLDGSLIKAEDTDTMSIQWTASGDGQFTTSPVAANGYVYEGSSTGKVYAMDASNGAVVWSANAGAAVSSIAAGNGRIVATTSSGIVMYGAVGSGFTPVTPVRLLDTRTVNVPAGWTPGAPATPAQPLDLTVAGGTTGVPSTATAVVLNLTATDVTDGTFVQAYPSGSPPPMASNLNVGPGETRANLVTVGVGAGGRVTLANHVGSVALVADLMGYYSQDGLQKFSPVTPSRLVDTRTAGGKLGTSAPLTVHVQSTAKIPADASAVVLNVTAVDATAPSYLRVSPSGVATATSSVNFLPGEIVPNLTTVKVGTDGSIDIRNAVGATNVVVDVVGAYSPTGVDYFNPMSPARAVDTRISGGPVLAGSPRVMPLGSIASLPANAVAAIFNLTATDVSDGTFVKAYPSGPSQPNTSNLNLRPGETRPNLALSSLDGSGEVSVANAVGSVDIIIDMAGYFAPAS